MAGALSFFSILSLIPIFIIGINSIGKFLGIQEAQSKILDHIHVLFSDHMAGAVDTVIGGAQTSGSEVASLLSALMLIYVSTLVFQQFQNSLKAIWKVPVESTTFIRQFFKIRLNAFLMLCVVGLIFFLSMFYEVGIQFVQTHLQQWFPNVEKLQLSKYPTYVFSIPLYTFFLALIFKYVAPVKIGLGDVWLGAFLTALLLYMGRFLLTYYFRLSLLITLYGAAGSILIILLWVYYSAQMFLLGAEFTYVYTHQLGSLKELATLKIWNKKTDPNLTA